MVPEAGAVHGHYRHRGQKMGPAGEAREVIAGSQESRRLVIPSSMTVEHLVRADDKRLRMGLGDLDGFQFGKSFGALKRGGVAFRPEGFLHRLLVDRGRYGRERNSGRL